jgi:hypothetical protein
MNKLWQRFADFLHQANLIPLVVVVSTYHYYQALRSHDPLLVAMPIALFVDLLHFRTVQRAVRANQFTWKLTALLTTAIAFGLQWIFYSQPTAGTALPSWQVILFASIVPVGLAIMAWHHAARAQDTATNWRIQVEEAQNRVAQLETESAAAKQQTGLALAEAQEALAKKDVLEKEFYALRSELEAAQGAAAEALSQVDLLQEALKEAQPSLQAWKAMNQRAQVAAQVHVGQIDAREAAEIIGMSVDTVRRDVARLNGAR